MAGASDEQLRAWWAAADWPRLVPAVRDLAADYIPLGWPLSTDERDDIVARALVKVWLADEIADSPGAFVRVVVRNLARSRLRDRRDARFTPLSEAHRDETAGPDAVLDELAYRQRVGRLRAALQMVPDPERRVIVLHYLHGQTHAQIAATLGLTVSACKMRAFRGLRHLRDVYFDTPLPRLNRRGHPPSTRRRIRVPSWREYSADVARARRDNAEAILPAVRRSLAADRSAAPGPIRVDAA